MAERFLCFLSGIGVGLGTALLLAPKSGAETRAALRERASEGETLVKRQTDMLRNTVEDSIQRGKQAARTTGQGIAEALADGKAVLQR